MTLKTNLSILDAGSASGGNTLLLQKLGFKVSSLEFSELGVDLQLKKGLAVTRGDICKIPWEASSFDAFICMDVLEHIENDELAVKELQRVLKAGGRYLITVPADPKLWSEHDVAVNHFRRYTKEQIFVLLKGANLEIDSVWYSNVLLKPLIKIARKRSNGSDLTAVNKYVNWCLLRLTNFESGLFIRKFPGVTLWVIGSKSNAN